jgi:glucosamine--fructose-6-phosphate aminotransferase (isomerizing)
MIKYREKHQADMAPLPDSRSEHPFHMFEEIRSQPKIVDEILSILSKQIDGIAEEIFSLNPKKILLTGCGTSYNAAIEGRYVLSNLTKFDAESLPSFELGNYVPVKVFKNACVIAISSSGATKAVHSALSFAKSNGSRNISIVGLPGTRLAEYSDEVIVTPGGRESSHAVTRSYVSQIVVLNMISIKLARLCGYEESSRSMEVEMKMMPERINRFVEEKSDAMNVLARRCSEMDGILFTGAGPNWATALEGSLKTVEVARTCSMGFELEEILHGPRVLLNEKKSVIIIEPEDRGLARAAEITKAISHLKSLVITVTSDEDAKSLDLTENSVIMPNGLSEILTPILYIVPLQLFAYYLAVEKKMNPDTLREDEDYLRASRTASTRFS